MERQVLNAGYVKLLEWMWMGGDDAVVRNARRCWRSEGKASPQADRNLIRHLLKNRHMTPFEAMVFTFDVKAPIFVARQWMRHRIGSYNEESLRYCVAERTFYVPSGLKQSEKTLWELFNYEQFERYERLIEEGMPKEQARAILPLGTYTKFYWTVNGSSLMNFLRLRMDKAAQAEIQEYARAIFDLAREVAPITFDTFAELVLQNGEKGVLGDEA